MSAYSNFFPSDGGSMNGTYALDSSLDIPVLIIGGGPTGLLSAYMLSKLGVKSLLIEKYPERLAAPKAHALCPRTLEICRQFGLDTNAMRKLGSPRDDAFWVNFVTNLSGERIGVLPYERMDPEVLDTTPEMIHNIPQPEFEEFVAHELENDQNVRMIKGVAFVSCSQTDGFVHSVLEERATKARSTVKSRHVIACDGAKSQVRKHLGIECDGEDGYETMMTIHFRADLRPVVKERVGMLHWITDPACSGFIIAYDLGGNQVLISNFNSEKHPVERWDTRLAHDTVAAAIGRDIPFDLLSFRPWVLSRKIARRYRDGNVFLVGDAAHSFPPTGGLGLNSGLADAHNLAYKIAAVHQGWAADSILDTYQADRRQIALVNSAQSVKNGKQIFSFLRTMGIAGIDDIDEARRNLLRSINEPAKQAMIADEVEGQREHFDNLEIHIGYVYGCDTTPSHASHYVPKFVAGARLPHAWIKMHTGVLDISPVDVSYVKEFSEGEVTTRHYSTLDLCAFNSFTLIASSRQGWKQKFLETKNRLKLREVKLKLWVEDTDFTFQQQAQAELFNQEGGFALGTALLVRPDQHLLGSFGLETSSDDLEMCVLAHLGW